MKVFKSIIFLALFSIQTMGQNSVPLAGNWIEKELGIGEILTSDKAVDLRIFLNGGITNGGHVIWIYRDSEGWQGTKYDYVLKTKKGNITDKIANSIKTELKSDDWDSFWTKLEMLDIRTLPSQNEIKNKLRKEVTTKRGKSYEVMVVADGSSYDLVLKAKDRVVNYSFHEPWAYSQKYPEVEEVRKYSDIILTLEREFQIKFRE